MKNNFLRSNQAIILLWIVIGADALSGISSLMQIHLLGQLNKGIQVSDQQLELNDLREVVVGLLYLIAMIVSVVTFIRWFRRAYYNLHQLTTGLSFNEGSAAGSWFIPFVNLYRPYAIMKELFSVSNRYLTEQLQGFSAKGHGPLMKIWWAMWILSNLIGQIASRTTLDAEDVDSLILSSQLMVISSVVTILTGILAILLIKRYQELERKLWQFKGEEDIDEHSYPIDDQILDTPI